MQLRRMGTHRGIEYIVRLTDSGLRYAMIDSHGKTAVVCEKGSEMPSLEDVQKHIDAHLADVQWG